MNLQHAVQHSLNVSLTRLHTNKPAGTRRLTPTPAYFNIIPALLIRTKNQKNMFINIWNAHHIFVSTQSACAQTRCRCTNNRIIFTCKDKLEYVNYRFFFFPEKGSVRINRVYGLLILQYFSHILVISSAKYVCDPALSSRSAYK